MGYTLKKVKGWIMFLSIAQILFLFVFIFCYDLYIYPQTWISPTVVVSLDKWKELAELPPKYSENIDLVLLIFTDIFEGIVLIGSNMGISQLVFTKRYFVFRNKEKVSVFTFGGLAIIFWLLYCRYGGYEYYRLAWNMVIPEIFSLMLLAFILIGMKQGADAPPPPTP